MDLTATLATLGSDLDMAPPEDPGNRPQPAARNPGAVHARSPQHPRAELGCFRRLTLRPSSPHPMVGDRAVASWRRLPRCPHRRCSRHRTGRPRCPGRDPPRPPPYRCQRPGRTMRCPSPPTSRPCTDRPHLLRHLGPRRSHQPRRGRCSSTCGPLPPGVGTTGGQHRPLCSAGHVEGGPTPPCRPAPTGPLHDAR